MKSPAGGGLTGSCYAEPASVQDHVAVGPRGLRYSRPTGVKSQFKCSSRSTTVGT